MFRLNKDYFLCPKRPEDTQRNKFLSTFLKATVVYIVVLVSQFILLYPLHITMDLPIWAESNYMGWGRNFALGMGTSEGISTELGYILFYSIITRAFGTINSIFFMKYFLIICVSLLVVTFLIQNLRSYSISLLLSLLWVMSDVNINREIMVYHFGVLVFLLALVVSKKNRLISVILMLVCVFIRLEYIFIFVPYLAYLIIDIARNKRMKNLLSFNTTFSKILSLALLLMLLVLVLYMASHVSSWEMGVKRTWFAFKQHYALTQVTTGRYNLNPWTDYNIIIGQDFPNAHSLIEALLANPKLFIFHVARNILNLPKRLLNIIVPSRSLFSFSALHLLAFLTIFLFIIYTIYVLQRWNNFVMQFKNVISKFDDVLFLSFISPLALIPSLIFYTKSFYSLMIMPFILVYLGVLILVFLKLFNYKSFFKIILYILICSILLIIAIGPRPFSNKIAQRPVYEKVLKLQKIWPDKKIKLLGVTAVSYANYIGYERCTPVEALPTVNGGDIKSKINLQDLLTSFDPDAVLINGWLSESKNFNKDSLGILHSKDWVVYDIGNEKIYFSRRKLK